MLRIAISSIITAAALYAINIAADSTPYLIIAMLTAAGFAAGAFIMLAVLNDSDREVK